MKEIVIVASAQYDKSRLMGSEIDSFKEVVKMNRFVTGPYEKHLGSKCTMWVCNRKLILGKTPFGYLYSVPLSLGYLKSNLTVHGYKNVKVFDLNQDFWYRNNMTAGLNPFHERYKTLLQNLPQLAILNLETKNT